MSDQFTETFLDPEGIEGLISHETRSLMADMLEFSPEPSPQPLASPAGLVRTPLSKSESPLLPPKISPTHDRNSIQSLGANTFSSPIPAHLSSVLPSLITLTGRILHELETDLPRLLALNPSRRDAIAQHLEKLAGGTSQPGSLTTQLPPAGKLRRWIEGPRTSSQNTALRAYFEEVAIISLGQAILLKVWSDRGIRKWSESDLGRLNWALSTALKPHIPLDREGWQITRPNLYSWFNPSPILQREIWAALESWRITDEGPGFLLSILTPLRRAHPENLDPSGYDSRFFKSIWDHISLFGLNTEPETGLIRRNKIIFSPTLRNGSIVRTGPTSVNWIGLEASAFQLMLAELMQIWWGPASPPFWSIGTGLEVHARDQLALNLCSSKPSVISRIAEMEACDAAFVFEEQMIRAQGRSTNSNRYREQLDSLPYFKKLRSAGTTLGDLQACVALTKLRPGGILIWAREEALCAKDGSEMLNTILNRAKLICEWDFSELEHSLPATSPLYPKNIYLFQKETNIEARLSHRPVRHSVQGQLRSHIELSSLLEDAFQSITRTIQPRGQWSILSHPSPTTQRDWIEKWPDPTSHSMVRKLDQLRIASLPLANFTTIRPTPDGDPNRGGKWSIHSSLRGFWLTAEYDSEGRKLVARHLPRSGQEVTGSGFLVLVPDEGWVAPLCNYLMSELVQKWLDHQCERRGERWVLNEQVVKWIPVPKTLLGALGVPSVIQEFSESSFALPLPGEWEKLASDVTYHPQKVRESLNRLPANDTLNQKIHSTLFVRTARALDYIQYGQTRLFSLVTSEGRIRWRELLDILPKGECITVSLHPKIRLSGSLPPHLPIGKIDRVKAPTPGIFLATESGFSLHIGSENSVLIHILWEQLEGLSHPTWSELLQYLRVPRKIELAESTALDVLRSHGEQTSLLKELKDLLSICQLY